MSRAATQTKHKHYILNEAKIKRAQKLLGARTETEAIEQALDEVIVEHQRDRLARNAHLRFIKSGIEIKDVFGRLDGQK